MQVGRNSHQKAFKEKALIKQVFNYDEQHEELTGEEDVKLHIYEMFFPKSLKHSFYLIVATFRVYSTTVFAPLLMLEVILMLILISLLEYGDVLGWKITTLQYKASTCSVFELQPNPLVLN